MSSEFGHLIVHPGHRVRGLVAGQGSGVDGGVAVFVFVVPAVAPGRVDGSLPAFVAVRAEQAVVETGRVGLGFQVRVRIAGGRAQGVGDWLEIRGLAMVEPVVKASAGPRPRPSGP